MSSPADFPPQVQHPHNDHVQPALITSAHIPRILLVAVIFASLLGCVIGAVTFMTPLLMVSVAVLVASLVAFMFIKPGTPE
jgi:hypothetical protein